MEDKENNFLHSREKFFKAYKYVFKICCFLHALRHSSIITFDAVLIVIIP